jgi:hypothetical protein
VASAFDSSYTCAAIPPTLGKKSADERYILNVNAPSRRKYYEQPRLAGSVIAFVVCTNNNASVNRSSHI